jgi:hypothetical protein
VSISVRPATVPATAQESARLLMKLYDQQQRIDRPFKDEDDYLPPDGVLDRTEFPSARFDMIDKLQLSDGRISETELAMAIARLDAPAQQRVATRAQETHEKATSLLKRFGGAFASFGLGGLVLAGGLILGGPIGLVGAGLGVLGVGGGFALAVKTVFDSGKAGVALFKDLEAAFAQLK